MSQINKVKKQIRFFNNKLFIKTNNGEEKELGAIITKKGKLTRIQKLKAVHANGEWIEI